MDDWNKLNRKQQSKVREMACNDWTDIQVFLKNEDVRARVKSKLSYNTIVIKYKRNGREFTSTISAQVSGRE